MGKVEDLIRTVVLYHSERAARQAVRDLRRQAGQALRETRAIRKALDGLSRRVADLMEERPAGGPAPASSGGPPEGMRFTRGAVRGLRKRFGLTQRQLATLLHVAMMTVNSWERGRTRPSDENVARLMALRPMGQGEIDAALGRQTPPARDPRRTKRLRARLGLTQRALAALLPVSGSAVAVWERGISGPGRSSLKALARLEAMTREQVDRLLGRTGTPGRSPEPAGRVVLSPAQILEIRKDAGLSQRAMAKAIGASLNSVCNWEKGHSKPRANSMEKLLEMMKTQTVARDTALSPAQILEIRKNAGLSQREMAKAIGASVNSVCNWERGNSRPLASSLEKLLTMKVQTERRR